MAWLDLSIVVNNLQFVVFPWGTQTQTFAPRQNSSASSNGIWWRMNGVVISIWEERPRVLRRGRKVPLGNLYMEA